MNIVLVCSHGGHLVEMFEIMECFSGHELHFFTYKEESTKELKNAHFFDNIAIKPLSLPFVIARMCGLYKKIRPALVVSTGAELAVPAFFASCLFPGVRRVYMECSAQVYSASLTGRLVYPITDLFIVQWDSLLKKYGKKARYVGGLI
jgi:beta-1,4-N-acetylglucosaminyltransferase